MAHGGAEIIMPVSSVDAVPFIKIHRVRNIGQIVARPGHVGVAIFGIDAILTGYSGVLPGAGGYYEGAYCVIALVCVETLL